MLMMMVFCYALSSILSLLHAILSTSAIQHLMLYKHRIRSLLWLVHLTNRFVLSYADEKFFQLFFHPGVQHRITRPSNLSSSTSSLYCYRPAIEIQNDVMTVIKKLERLTLPCFACHAWKWVGYLSCHVKSCVLLSSHVPLYKLIRSHYDIFKDWPSNQLASQLTPKKSQNSCLSCILCDLWFL